MVSYWIDGFTNSIIQNAIHMCAQAKIVDLYSQNGRFVKLSVFVLLAMAPRCYILLLSVLKSPGHSGSPSKGHSATGDPWGARGVQREPRAPQGVGSKYVVDCFISVL